jgi:ferrochelatase
MPATGVLITNLGTPDAPTPAAVRTYLRQFLSDRRVVDLPPLIWRPILEAFVLRTRPRRSVHAYGRIWTAEGSPLLSISRKQEAALRAHFAHRQDVRIALGMRYGNPSIESALEALRAAGSERVIVLPLYPQYSSSSTASTFDAVARTFRRWVDVPGIQFIRQYYDQPWYIRAVAASVREAWSDGPSAQRLLFSFHGVPKRTVAAGDPYAVQCRETALLIVRELGLSDDRWALSFQSRFGGAEWVRPYVDQTLKGWADEGIESVDVVCPGFAADCLETLEEVAMRYRDVFLAAGGKRFRYIPALNDRPDHIKGLAQMIEAAVGGDVAVPAERSRI